MSTTYVPRVQKRTLDPLKLQFQITEVLCKSSKCSTPEPFPPSMCAPWRAEGRHELHELLSLKRGEKLSMIALTRNSRGYGDRIASPGHIPSSSLRAGEMASRVRALVRLPENPVSTPSAHMIRTIQFSSNCSSRGSDTHF